MLKIFLVEDEVIVREGIKKNIDWEKYGFTFVGEAGDGELAYPLIRETKPDVIITDIRMPFMDGLELGRLVRRDMPDVKIIILSGFDEFQYAKEAIAIGVTEYLLKPVSSAKIIETIQRVKAKIDEEHEQRDFITRYHAEMEERELLEHNRFFNELVTVGKSLSALMERAELLGLELLAPSYCILLFQFHCEGQGGDAYSECEIELQGRVDELCTRLAGCLLFSRDLEGFALLVKGDSQAPAGERARFAAQELSELFSASASTDYFIGVGQPVHRLLELPQAFETVCRAFAHRYFDNHGRVAFFGQTHHTAESGDSFSLRTLDPAKVDKSLVERFFKIACAEEAEHFVEDYFESIGSEHIASLLFRQYIAMDLHLAAEAFLEELGVGKEPLIERTGDIERLAPALATVEGTSRYLVQLLRETLLLRDRFTSQKHTVWFDTACTYINDNYANSDISLNQTARAVNISPTHFSAIFSQEAGQTFIEYLTGIRMEKARELLRCSNMKSSEIAYAVGYKDPHYFSYLFKKLQGCTPSDFRAGKAVGAYAE